jgi:hypothetical protein
VSELHAPAALPPIPIGYVTGWAPDPVPDDIVTRMVVRVSKITGSSSDDWIYQHFGYNLS